MRTNQTGRALSRRYDNQQLLFEAAVGEVFVFGKLDFQALGGDRIDRASIGRQPRLSADEPDLTTPKGQVVWHGLAIRRANQARTAQQR